MNWISDHSLSGLRILLDGSPGLGRPVFFGGSEDSVLSRLGAQLRIRPQEHSYAHLRALRLTKEKEDEGGEGLFLLSSLHEFGFVGLQRLYLEKCARGDLGELQVPKLRSIFIDGGKVQGDLSVFHGLLSLTSLTIKNLPGCIGDIDILASLIHLKDVDLSNTGVFGNIALLGGLRDLVKVDFYECRKIEGKLFQNAHST